VIVILLAYGRLANVKLSETNVAYVQFKLPM